MSDAAAPAKDGDAPPKAKVSLDLILVLLNTLALAGAMGMLVYTKLLFKRPPITEDAERERIAAMKEKASKPLVPGTVTFEQFTANIESSVARPGGVDPATGLQIRGRLHYTTMAFTLELRDSSRADEIEDLRPRIMDSILHIMGHKNFNELSSAQGRYLLRTQLVESINRQVAHYEGAGEEKPVAAAGGEHAGESHAAPAEGGSRESASEHTSGSDDMAADGNYSVREGLVTNVFFTQFVVQ